MQPFFISSAKMALWPYYVPGAKAWQLIPQLLFNTKQGVSSNFVVEETHATLRFDGVETLELAYDNGSHLPIALGKNNIPGVAKVNLGGVLVDDNANLSPAQKLLLHWHRVQQLLQAFPFLLEKYKQLRIHTTSFEDSHNLQKLLYNLVEE